MTFADFRASVRVRLARAFSRPRVLACTSLSEVLPLDLMLLRVQVADWGWLEIRGPQGFRLRQFFSEPATLEVAVPVRAALTVKVFNSWGSRSYPIDTHTSREEVWRPPELAFSVRMPDDVQPSYERFGAPRDAHLPQAVLPRIVTPPSLATRIPGLEVRKMPGTGSPPDLVVRALPDITAPVAAPAHPALPAWNPQLPMATLESRMAQARIEP